MPYADGNDPDLCSEVRATLWRMARLLKQLRLQSSTPNSELSDFFTLSNFRQVVSAARVVSGFNEDKNKTPSLALKLGHSLKRCATILLKEGT